MRRRGVGLVVGGLVIALSGVAGAQSTQIKPRVLLMVDTSGSMNFHLNNDFSTGGDGSDLFKTGAGLSRSQASTPGFAPYEGFETYSPNVCSPNPAAPFDGVNSRLYAAKAAIQDVINGSGDVDWGLMRYNGSYCALSTTFTNRACTKGSQCATNNCTGGACFCNNDDDCRYGEFCVNNRCGTDGNLCNTGTNLLTGMTDTRNATTCGNHGGDYVNCTNPPNGGNNCQVATGVIPQTYTGGCGTNAGTGSTTCATPRTCQTNADCGTGGNCLDAPNLPGVKWCDCATGTCNSPWSTCGTVSGASGSWCLYANNCRGADGGFVLVDPNASNFSSSQVLPWIDNQEIYTNNGKGSATVDFDITNPELRANGGTPLAGAARAATQWYTNIVNGSGGESKDPKITCRPYVLIQLTDGNDSCDSDTTNGPVAAAAGFVSATAPNAKNPNKVYVIGLAFGSSAGPLDAIAQAGGTGAARLANSQSDIEAALADIVSSSVLVEKCNGIDDNCDGQCDENFPGVAVSANPKPGETCSNPHPATNCDNGYSTSVACYSKGVFVCSADQLGQVCNAPTCTVGVGATVSSPSAGVERLTGVTGLGAGNVGQVLFVNGAKSNADNGAFLISAVGGNTVDLTNAGVITPEPNTVSYGVPPTQGLGTIGVASGTVTLTVTTGSTAGIVANLHNVTIVGALAPGNNGTFLVTAVDTANNTITYSNPNAVAGSGIHWAVDICPLTETCNGKDDNCDGIIDNCGDNTPGSCCASACPACAKPPFIELCNGCDDDCNGIVDDNTQDTGTPCGNNVGDCAGGTTRCCQQDPNASGGTCTQDQTQPPTSNKDQVWCQGGNPGYPTVNDQCDGTDDNCNGVSNDNSARICFTDGTNTLPQADDGIGACHHGVQQCTTNPLPAGDPGCPAGWPAGKPCPNPSHSYGSCDGLVTPQPELCDGVDNDCNGTVDDNVQDPWANPADPSHACCDTGNLADCSNTNGGTTCKLGGYMCVGGKKVCVGSVHKTLEICDGIDNDCNGAIDDVPGVGSPCTGNGVYTQGPCKAELECVTNGQPPQCVQVKGDNGMIGPQPETCNGIDDNCNGAIDDNGPPLAQNPLPGVGVMCDIPKPPLDHPPCMAGTTVCVPASTGKCMPGQLACIDCEGAVGPMPNQCNGVSTDCTGQPNTNGNCPSGFACLQGNCVAACQPGEFPCPGGYVCNTNTTACDSNGQHQGCCVPDACAKITCQPGFICQIDANGNGTCVDPCKNVTCPTGYLCQTGACVDASCRTQGCPTGQVCVLDGNGNPVCQNDPCADVMCMDGQFCQDGQCVDACKGPCPPGTYCDKGTCAPDPCAHVPCVEGEVCTVQNGVGVCVPDQCQFGCNLGQACCGGACISDPCATLHCPEDTHCALNSACQATCETNPAAPKDQIVGAGGGGFGCSVAGHGGSPAGAAWLCFAFALFVVRRRARGAEVRR